MGQNQTRQNNTSKTSHKSPGLPRRIINNEGLCKVNILGTSCFGYTDCSQPRRRQNVMCWKQHVVDQLSAFEYERWSQLLIEYLKRNNTEPNDVKFQSEFFWADFNSAKKQIHYTKPLGVSKSRQSMSIENSLNQEEEDICFPDPDQINRTSQKKPDFARDLRKMIAASDILEERVLNQDNWMQKSFNLRPSEDLRSRAPSLENFKLTNNSFHGKESRGKRGLDQVSNPINNLYKEESKHMGITKGERVITSSFRSIESPCAQAYSRNSLERYENNTFIVQQGVEQIKTKDTSRHNFSREDLQEGNNNGNVTQLSDEEKLYRAVMNYKTLTGLIDQHLSQENNTFACLITIFEDYYEKEYGDVSEKVKKGELLLSEVKTYSTNATRELQQFIRIIFEGISFFYKLEKLKVGRDIGQEITLFNRDNMLNFVTSIIFKKKIHDTIFKLYQIQNMPVEDTYEKSLKRCQNLGPQDFGVQDEFCLNERTAQYFRQHNLGDQQNDLSLSPTNSQEPSMKTEFEVMIVPENEEEKTQDFQSSEAKANKEPYYQAIETLRKLEHRKSPLHKLKNIVKVAEYMSISIQNYYKSHSVHETKKLDADQTLIILMYVLAKSGLSDVMTHCKIIENFTTNNVLDSVSGYYATTLEACVNCICSMSFEEIGAGDGLSPNSGDYNICSMPSWVGAKQMQDASSLS